MVTTSKGQSSARPSSAAKFSGRVWHEWLFSVCIGLAVTSIALVGLWLYEVGKVDPSIGGQDINVVAVLSRTARDRGFKKSFNYGAGAGSGATRYRRRRTKSHTGIDRVEQGIYGEEIEFLSLLKKLKHTWQPNVLPPGRAKSCGVFWRIRTKSCCAVH